MPVRVAIRCCIVLAALSGAAAAVAAVASRVPNRLRVSTDIVGFPIYYNYDVARLEDLYYLVVFAFPLFALVLYLALAWVTSRLGLLERPAERIGGSPVPPDVHARPAEWAARLASAARVAGLGCIIGLEVAVVRGTAGIEVWLTVGAGALAYLVAVLAGSWIAKRALVTAHAFSAVVSASNALLSPITIGGLLAISLQTTLTVTSGHATHHYPWFPLWLAVPLVTGAVLLIGIEIVRSRSAEALRVLERKALIVIGGSVLVFLFHSELPGAPGGMDMFHEGEYLVPARLTAQGAFPWRDILTIHGLFQDTLSPMLGQHLLDGSRWGAYAGWQLILHPLAYVSLWLFGARFFWRNWLFLSAFGLILLGGYLVPPFTRFIFWPLILIVLGFALEEPRWWLSGLLGASLVAQAVLMPEAAYCVPACALAVVLRDVVAVRSERRFWPALSRTVWTAAGGSAALAVLAAVLTREGALQSFISYFAIFAPGHDLTGGFVISWALDGQTGFMMAGPVVALLVSALYFSVHLVRRRPLDTQGWVMVAAAALTAVYYTKFLDRADPPHLAESYWVAVPLIALVLFKVCNGLDGMVTRTPRIAGLARSLSLRPVALVLLLATILLLPASLLERTETLAQQYRASAPSDPWLQPLGYSKGGMDQASYDDIRTVLRSYLGPNDWIYDFSNAPGLYYYLLGYTPHTRYYHVSMAIPQAAQEDLIAELRHDPPKLVVFSNDRYGAPNWDSIPDMVRHYDVSQYLLQHYRPLLSVRGQVIYARKGTDLPAPQSLDPHLHQKVATDGLPFQVGTCSWGYSPNFLSTSPGGAAPTTASPTPVPPTDATIEGWFSDPSLSNPVQQVALLIDGQIVSTTSDMPPRPDKADPRGPVGSSARGFELAVPRSALAAADSIQVATIPKTGDASFIPFDRAAKQLPGTRGSTAPAGQITLPGVGTVPVGSTAQGAVESITSKPHVVEIAPPPGKTWASYRWLEIDSRSGFRPDTFSLSDRLSTEPERSITFQTLETSPHSYRVQVGSCAQWHAYGAGPLFLSSGSSQSIASIKLVP